MHLSGVITRLLELNLPFVCYRLPAAQAPVLLTGGSFEYPLSASSLGGRKGFIIVPFDAAPQDPVLFYAPRRTVPGWHHDLYSVDISESSAEQILPHPPATIGYEQYQEQAGRLIRALKKGTLKKVVLSRVLAHSLPDDFQAGTFFQKLCEKYPHAFVSVFNDGKGRCWMGASPEMLLRVNNHHGQTVSLAATQAVQANKSAPGPWQQKETLEQELVTGYIRQTLLSHHIENIKEGPLETLIAGPVAHLRKSFDFTLSPGADPLQLALALHPTPAVCGLPAPEAFQMIRAAESHQRSYYSGFLGPVDGAGHTNLFVNLRCMQIIAHQAFLYVGGGLLPASDIEAEWQETEKKAETLLGLL